MSTFTTEYIDCANCGTVFAVQSSLLRRFRENGRSFYCPNGHVNAYTETDLTRARKERDEARRRAETAERMAAAAREREQAELRSHAATKGRLTKLKHSVDAGECPCCHKTFPELAAHMTLQHPEWVPGETEPTKRLGAGSPDAPAGVHPRAWREGHAAAAAARNPYAFKGRAAALHRAWADGHAAKATTAAAAAAIPDAREVTA